ncbi:MAG: GGDEF domain-containing protein [Gammaproteobacteria bacterium]
MSQTTDWKQKYRDSLLEMEVEEKRWREIEQVLRRLIGRLCAAGFGVDAEQDAELRALAAANRRNADAAELERLAASLTRAVVAVDGASPASRTAGPAIQIVGHTTLTAAPVAQAATRRSGRWDATCVAVAALLERLKPGATSVAAIHTLLAEVAIAQTDTAMAAVVASAADLIRERGELLMRERLQAAALLSEVTARLEEMAGYLTESNSASRSHFDDTQTLNDTVMSHVRDLTDEISEAKELSLLQTVVSARLESVAKQVSDFRAREQTRQVEYNGRAEHMRARIADLERETQELNSKLDLEKHVARLDPLTGIANRKSFEERFALEIARREQCGTPLAMLLWDIDSFKAINDSYGHRAGDRVLQSVAGCFTAALRSTDFVARIGGEEFAVLLTGLVLADAVKVANQVRTAVEGLRFHFRGKAVRVTVSCGITELHRGDGSEQAFDRADGALYRAKNSGKNLCVAA